MNLNWSRSQYYLALNLAVLGVATGLLKLDTTSLGSVLIIGIYLIGSVCCVLAFAAGAVQRGYYRQTKLHKRRLENLLDLGDLAIRTTPGMGGTIGRLGKVTTFNSIILGLVLTADVAGIAFTAIDASRAPAAAPAAPASETTSTPSAPPASSDRGRVDPARPGPAD